MQSLRAILNLLAGTCAPAPPATLPKGTWAPCVAAPAPWGFTPSRRLLASGCVGTRHCCGGRKPRRGRAGGYGRAGGGEKETRDSDAGEAAGPATAAQAWNEARAGREIKSLRHTRPTDARRRGELRQDSPAEHVNGTQWRAAPSHGGWVKEHLPGPRTSERWCQEVARPARAGNAPLQHSGALALPHSRAHAGRGAVGTMSSWAWHHLHFKRSDHWLHQARAAAAEHVHARQLLTAGVSLWSAAGKENHCLGGRVQLEGPGVDKAPRSPRKAELS